MKYSIEFSATAKNDLREIAFYIAEETKNISMALNFVEELEKSVEVLKEFPKSGAMPKDHILLSFHYRYLVHRNYLIFYKFAEESTTVYIEAVFNAKRDYKKIMKNYI